MSLHFKALQDIHFKVMEKVVESMQANDVESDIMLQATHAKHYIFGRHREKAEPILELIEGDDIKKKLYTYQVVL
jgi:hypothetical protein